MVKVNLVKHQLPCASLDCVLKANRTSAIERLINEAMHDYRAAHGHGYEIVTGYSMVGNKCIMSIWQMPPPGKKPFRDFVVNAAR